MLEGVVISIFAIRLTIKPNGRITGYWLLNSTPNIDKKNQLNEFTPVRIVFYTSLFETMQPKCSLIFMYSPQDVHIHFTKHERPTCSNLIWLSTCWQPATTPSFLIKMKGDQLILWFTNKNYKRAPSESLILKVLSIKEE